MHWHFQTSQAHISCARNRYTKEPLKYSYLSRRACSEAISLQFGFVPWRISKLWQTSGLNWSDSTETIRAPGGRMAVKSGPCNLVITSWLKFSSLCLSRGGLWQDWGGLYWICYNISSVSCFVFFGCKASGILGPWPGIEPAPPALEGKDLTTGLPGKSHKWQFFNSVCFVFDFTVIYTPDVCHFIINNIVWKVFLLNLVSCW